MFTAKSLTKSLVPVLALGSLALGASAHAQIINYTSTITLANPTVNGITITATNSSDNNVNAAGVGTSDQVGGFTASGGPTAPAFATYTSAFTDLLSITDQASGQTKTLTVTGNLTTSANTTQVQAGSTSITLNQPVYELDFPINRFFVTLNRFDEVSSGGNPGSFSFRFQTNAVPEPGSVAMLVGMSLTGAGFLARKRRK